MNDVNGIDRQFTFSGWKIESYNMQVLNHEYTWGETYSQTTFSITLERDAG
jgi:hypothetical protein